MKKMMMTLVALLTIAATGKAMSYEQARNEALFLTDKMAYELNLTDAQYEAAYEINLDYLMGVTSYDDVYGTYWERRNLDMSYVLFDWQWSNFIAASYFYRPLYWDGGYWHFGIYARYPHRDYFYFGRPVFYASYRGGHAWHRVGGHGYYHGRRDHYRPVGRSHFGMLDRWNRGDYRHNHSGRGHYGRGGSNYGGHRNSSTRTTVNGRGNGNYGNGRGNGNYGNGNRGNGNYGNGNRGNGGSFGGHRDHNSTTNSTTTRPNTTSRLHHGNASSYSGNRISSQQRLGNYSNSRSTFSRNSATHTAPVRSSASFGGSRSHSSYSGSRGSSSFGGSRSSGSFSGSRGGGSSHSHSSGGGRSNSGGRSFGGHR